MIENNMSAVRLMIETDKKMTFQQIQISLGIGTSQMHKIFHTYVAVRKLCTRWILYSVTEAQKLCRVNGAAFTNGAKICQCGCFPSSNCPLKENEIKAQKKNGGLIAGLGDALLHIAKQTANYLGTPVVVQNSLTLSTTPRPGPRRSALGPPPYYYLPHFNFHEGLIPSHSVFRSKVHDEYCTAVNVVFPISLSHNELSPLGCEVFSNCIFHESEEIPHKADKYRRYALCKEGAGDLFAAQKGERRDGCLR
ncbi:hypothetical protein EVAR_9260_1 [Eumeta japonica]|uniref:Uncharacterized protein n=1 Tax=Eumeta variegata TaxID=151549 RepID=A0A4C1TMJ4_EUMVA|nr:hypothetical protein EVAR_9260_1 [Eumeta japonica]